MNEPVSMPPSAEPLTIGMLLYPDFTLLDVAGPQAALGMHGRTLLFWKTLEPVATDTGVSINPTATFSDCPQVLDVLFVPGGLGTTEAMKDPAIIDFLADAGATARYVTSVCSGALLLGMAGLLNGYRAATHWNFYEALEALGAIATHERVVADRNRFTGGGVTAGIDFGLTLLSALRGEEAAKVTQLALEYDPKPPFQAGTPDAAGPDLTRIARSLMGTMDTDAVAIAQGRRRAPAAT